MGHWNHRIVRKEYPKAVPEERYMLQIHEAHYDDEGNCYALTTEPMGIIGDSIKELAWTLKAMQRALKYPILDFKTRKELRSTKTSSRAKRNRSPKRNAKK